MQDWQVTLAKNSSGLPAQLAGVYLLFYGQTLDYVGQSENVRRRLTQPHHVYDPVVHNLIAMIHVAGYDERLALERYFNQKYNPANSYTGSDKQAGSFDDRFLALSAEQRRQMWTGPAFDEFEIPKMRDGALITLQILLPANKINRNAMQAPSVLSLPPEDIFGF